MFFADRIDAGKQLAHLLTSYKKNECIVYGIPRGGVVIGAEVAEVLKAPLELVFAHKIGHPYHQEYAIGAVSESGYLVGNPSELAFVGEDWLEQAKESQLQEIARKRALYLKDKKDSELAGKVAIIVDDGVATGLTMQVAIQELKNRKPQKIVVAVPVCIDQTAKLLNTMADEVVAVLLPSSKDFLGAVGAYYQMFDQVEDSEVMTLLSKRVHS